MIIIKPIEAVLMLLPFICALAIPNNKAKTIFLKIGITFVALWLLWSALAIVGLIISD